ncbi:hypothetical protein SDC9_102955 [bioreactor metagenome]|uniref:Uncharacterized protein n=1 Tax=bioreactor metagenome TaxID=1076179 RepID=A0A645B364_9ZZZZ
MGQHRGLGDAGRADMAVHHRARARHRLGGEGRGGVRHQRQPQARRQGDQTGLVRLDVRAGQGGQAFGGQAGLVQGPGQ